MTANTVRLVNEETNVPAGPVVAVQYPEKPNYTLTAETGSALAEKYKHLMRIDPDDKEAYEELKTAIKEVSDARIDNQKEEEIIKKPLNAFRTKVLNIGKAIRKNITELAEEPLKAEKKRIDDILQERKVEQQKLWIANLTTVRNLVGTVSAADSIDTLRQHLDTLNAFDIESLDFGDYKDEAATELANKRARVEETIAQIKQREKQDAENAKLKEQLAAMKAKLASVTPAPEPEAKPEPSKPTPQATTRHVSAASSAATTTKQAPRHQPKPVMNDFMSAPFDNTDADKLADNIAAVQSLKQRLHNDFKSPDCKNAMVRININLCNMIAYLEKLQDEL